MLLLRYVSMIWLSPTGCGDFTEHFPTKNETWLTFCLTHLIPPLDKIDSRHPRSRTVKPGINLLWANIYLLFLNLQFKARYELSMNTPSFSPPITPTPCSGGGRRSVSTSQLITTNQLYSIQRRVVSTFFFDLKKMSQIFWNALPNPFSRIDSFVNLKFGMQYHLLVNSRSTKHLHIHGLVHITKMTTTHLYCESIYESFFYISAWSASICVFTS